MTSKRPSPPPHPKTSIARRYVLDLLREELALCDEGSQRHGRGLLRDILRTEWSENAERRGFRVEILDGYRSHLVRVDLPWSTGEGLETHCGCQRHFRMPFFELWPMSSNDRCPHIYAALRRVIDVIENEPDSPVVAKALRLDGAWRRTLYALDGFLSAEEDDPGPRKPEARRRLTWRVGASREGLEIGAWEQKVSRSTGRFTKGRRVGWNRLLSAPDLPLTDADRRVREALRDAYGKELLNLGRAADAGGWDLAPTTILRALVSHPLVFRMEPPNRELRVEAADLAIHVNAADPSQPDGPVTLAAVLDGHFWSQIPRSHRIQDWYGAAILVHDDGEHRLLVAASEPTTLDFLMLLEGQSPIIPKEGRQEVFERLSKVGQKIPLDVGDALAGSEKKAEARLVLFLEPEGTRGLAIRIRVRLAGPPRRSGGGSNALLPGTGRQRQTAIDEDGKIAVRVRDFPTERAAADALRERLGLPEEPIWGWRIADDDRALDLVAEAQRAADEGEVDVEWPSGQKRRVRGSLASGGLRIHIEDRRDWFGVNGSVEIDGTNVTLLSILGALRSDRRYVPVGEGDWAEISQELRERMESLREAVHERRNRLEVDLTGAPAILDLAGDDVPLEVSHRFRQVLERLDEAESMEPDPPDGLQADLRDYQIAGYRWLCRLAAWGVGGCLADDMGLGKTVQALAILLDRREKGPALVVAPTSVGFNWQRECERFAPALRTVFYRGTDREGLLDGCAAGDLVITSYALLQRDIDRLGEISWGTFILDEAQAIKNSRTKTSQAARKIEADWRLALTGTPVENHLGELWSLFRVISPGLFGSWESFRERYALPIERDGDADRRQALARRLRPFLLRRTKGEVLKELPERTEIELYADPEPDERALYDQARLGVLAELAAPADPERDQRFQVLAALTRLRQLACHPALVEDDWKKSSAKLDLLLETIEEICEGEHRALIFSQFVGHLKLVAEALAKRGVDFLYLDGSTPATERARRVDAFQEGRGDVFLISLKAGGTGLNLTGADYVVILDPWWNPAVEDQASDRAHRIGQTRSVTVYRLVTRETIEEEILKLHAEKRQLVASILDGTDRAARLTTEELVDLIRGGDGSENEAGNKAKARGEVRG